MKYGIMTGSGFDPEPSLAGLISNAQRLEKMGFDSIWMANHYSYDAINVLSLIGNSTSTIELGTAVVPSYPRHPVAMAQQVLTANAACKNRFTLGLGVSHKFFIEDELGIGYQTPARHMAEYLDVMMPLINSRQVDAQGDLYRVNTHIDIAESGKPSVLIAALGPRMLKIAGHNTDGTTLWQTGPVTIEKHTVPAIHQAAAEADRPSPRIVTGMPVVLTNNIQKARQDIDEKLEIYGQIPSYRAMLDREGADGPGDIAIVGNEQELRQQIQRLQDIGVTDLNAVLIDVESHSYERTLSFLANEKAASNP
jgi:5,10-methylenetetrahydromethanopterin reductase